MSSYYRYVHKSDIKARNHWQASNLCDLQSDKRLNLLMKVDRSFQSENIDVAYFTCLKLFNWLVTSSVKKMYQWMITSLTLKTDNYNMKLTDKSYLLNY